ADGHPVVAGRAGSWYLKEGDCAADDIRSYRNGSDHYQVVPCAQPHRLEVFATVTLPGSGSYPGVASVEASARRLCEARASSADLPENGMIGYFYPNQGRWWLFDDREALCVYSSLTPWSGPVKPSDSTKPGSPV
ncbi:septum formation family protein, partial [Kitasatospora sp. NPDC093558]|uniref:septum formation family protein n=1 Tax=Kitasatospora sp. NPDC093558 TaxID=3155201 RepID=UPI00341F6A1D